MGLLDRIKKGIDTFQVQREDDKKFYNQALEQERARVQVRMIEERHEQLVRKAQFDALPRKERAVQRLQKVKNVLAVLSEKTKTAGERINAKAANSGNIYQDSEDRIKLLK